MNLRLAAATLLLGTAFAAALSAPREALYQGLSFSRVESDAEGRLIRLLPASDGRLRVWVPLGEFSPLLVSATRIELSQGGVDPMTAISRSLARKRAGNPEPDGETALERILIRLESMRLRALYGPDELLETYLNLSSYGPTIEGAGAASLVYFGKNPDQLNLTEALELSVIPDHPIRTTLTGQDNPTDRQARRTAAKRLRKRLPQRLNSAGAVAATMPATKVTDRTNALHIFMRKE